MSRHNKKKVMSSKSEVFSTLLFLLLFITLKSKNFCDDVNDITTTTYVGRRRGSVRDFRDDDEDDDEEEQNKSLVVECRPTARRRDDRLASFTSSSSSQTAGVVVRTLSRRDKNVWVVGRLRGCGDDDGNELR